MAPDDPTPEASVVPTTIAGDERLPRTAAPHRYDLRLTPDLDAATFAGEVSIEVEVLVATDELVCNAAELTIDDAWLEGPDRARLAVTAQLDDATERLVLSGERPIPRGHWVLHLRFRGVLNDKLCGFYRSTFAGPDAIERTIATTQFEATDARRAFPCWDEPEYKAVFAVTLVVDPDLLAVSNAAELDRTPLDDGRVAVKFADTMKMSTYLVAFVVGPLLVTDPVDVDGVPLRIVYPPGNDGLTGFALEVGAFALRFFTDYFGVPYPGDKVDLVAIPDFAFGAMENLGCVTFREVLLLVDPDAATQPELERVVDVICHELAHMWFGDLVTMRWWEGIWLNEAFATFMETLACDAFRPAWHRWVGFGLSRGAAFDVDSLASTRPIEYPVVTPEDAEGMFDLITYEKGCSVVRMLEQWVGPEPFRAGIRRYIRTHAYGNTETTDLWDALEAETGMPVRAIADSWILHPGHPEVSVARDAEGVRLEQRTFRYDDGSGAAAPAHTWGIPVHLRHGRGATSRIETVLFDATDAYVELGGETDALVANAEGHGFYRVRYGAELLATIAADAHGLLSPIERCNLVGDAVAAHAAAQLDAPTLATLVAQLATDEDDLAVWQQLSAAIRTLELVLHHSADDDFAAFVRRIVAPAAARLGDEPAEGEAERTTELRGLLFALAGTTGREPAVLGVARTRFDAWVADRQGVDPSLAAAALDVVAAHADAATFVRISALLDGDTTPQEETRLLYALADVPAETEMAETLRRTLTEEIRTQNAPYVLRRAMTNRDRGRQAWTFAEENWDAIVERFPSNSIARMLEGIRSLVDDDSAAAVPAFLADHDVPQGRQIVAQHLEKQRVNVAARRRGSTALAGWLASEGRST